MTTKQKQSPPKKKKSPSKTEAYVNDVLQKALDNRNGADNIFELADDSYFANEAIEELNDDAIVSMHKNISELAVFNILKRNKKLQSNYEKALKDIAIHIVSGTNDIANDLIEERIDDAKNKVIQDKMNAKNKLEQEKLKATQKKLQAEKTMFKESLTATQKKNMKKLLNIDIDKV